MWLATAKGMETDGLSGEVHVALIIVCKSIEPKPRQGCAAKRGQHRDEIVAERSAVGCDEAHDRKVIP